MHREKESQVDIKDEEFLLKQKGYNSEKDCQTWTCQIRKLGLSASELPDLNEKERRGVVKRLSVNSKKSNENSTIVLEKFVLGELFERDMLHDIAMLDHKVSLLWYWNLLLR
jgi:hypothetical protein